MSKIINAENLPKGERVYLKKDYFGWRTVEPWKNPNTGKINWFNFITGGKKNLAILILILVILGFGYLGYQEQINNFKAVMDNPCSFCFDCQEQTRQVLMRVGYDYPKDFNISKINFSLPS